MPRIPCCHALAPGTALLLALGCSTDTPTDPSPAPIIRGSEVAANPYNALSAVVTVDVVGADSVAVRYSVAGSESVNVTPAAAPVIDGTMVPVLGLLPETAHEMQILAWGRGGPAEGPVLAFSTGPLPADLPGFRAFGPDPTPGFVVLASGLYGLVIDNSGRVVWYHRFPEGPGLNFQALPTGRYGARPPSTGPLDPAPWIEVDPQGRVTRTLDCADGLRPRFHDLLALADGSYWILCDEGRIMDLSELGGATQALVVGTVVQHIAPDGGLLFRWNPFDHFEITDVEEAERLGPIVNWTHGNALDLDAEGHLLVSFRNLSEITRIDTGTGEVRWRMGGLRNEFAFQGNPTPPFSRQHSVRWTPPGHLLLLDNLGDGLVSRALRIEPDAQARTARVVQSYRPLPPVLGPLGGTVQDLPGGRTLVSFGNAGRVEEYDADGNPVWWIEDPGYVFRAQRIASLYSPGTMLPR